MTAAATTGRGRFSLEALEDSRKWRVVFGLVLSVVVIAAVLTIVASFTGRFTNVITVRGELPGTGPALPVGSLVLYRNVTVGKVKSEGQGANGQVAATFQLYPAQAANVPKGVRALVEPLSIFGNQSVQLTLPEGATASGHLEAGDLITADTTTKSSSLQATVTQVFKLLNAVHPADLDTALTALATALRGEGTALGQTLDSASSYLGVLNPLLPTVKSDIGLTAPVSQSLAQAAPDLVATLRQGVSTSNTLSQFRTDLAGLLSRGTQASQHLTAITDQVSQTFPNLLNGSGPVLADISNNPNELRDTLSGLQAFASAVAASASHGPFLSVNVTLPIVDINAAVNAALGYQTQTQLAAALGSVFNPAPYTAADCPHYAGETSHCGGGSPAGTPTPPGSGQGLAGAAITAPQSATAPSAAGPSAAGSAAPKLADPYAAEQSAVQSIATALGGQPPASPALTSLVLVPLYSSMAVGS